ncbi:LIM domain only protein 7 [Euwallacea similis]|uniref:LIM domain only protein 7 n=1 Tax=Euwallacea similis TaxID=1736056 RepID=UPI00344EF064
MDNQNHEKESCERRNSNTEYVPTKCRVTRPPPPKPASNPMQFVKVAPPPLFKKAQEQIKKVEEIKKERKEIRDETEDWQQNLDNWKSCRRKRQEHIIERVVEVKKLTEQEELEKNRRKSKTFSEMLEERTQKGRKKVSLHIYNDDESNDLSDFGIGSVKSPLSPSSIARDGDTDDSLSFSDEKNNHTVRSPTSQEVSSSDQSESESSSQLKVETIETVIYTSNNSTLNSSPAKPLVFPKSKPAIPPKSNLLDSKFAENLNKDSSEQCTYEGAIQDYRSWIQNKFKPDTSVFNKKEVNKSKEFSEAQTVLPKGEISKRKGLFESSKSIEMLHSESPTSRRLSEDFANAKSLKDRLKSLESATDQSLTKVEPSEIQVSVKQRLANFNKQQDNEGKSSVHSIPPKISNYLLVKSNSNSQLEEFPKVEPTWKPPERCSSPETEIYMNKLNMFNHDLNSLMGRKSGDENFSDYPALTSAMDLTGVLSDREDSGIHTADVSCSVSQADEPIDTDNDAIINTIPDCIEKLKTEEQKLNTQLESQVITAPISSVIDQPRVVQNEPQLGFTREEIIDFTKEFLDSLIKSATEEIATQQFQTKPEQQDLGDSFSESYQEIAHNESNEKFFSPISDTPNMITVKENSSNFMPTDFNLPSSILEPPKVRPPPPPMEEREPPQRPIRRMNSTKRIIKEIHSKRSSFLGLEDTNDDLIDPDQIIEKPPDISSFLQKEQKLEKSLYKKMQEEVRTGHLSKVESQDSGLDIDRGRLSSDTWCSSVPSHERQDSEQTNSITSEEDEIAKKEREIIEMVEKEEKSKDKISYVSNSSINLQSPKKETRSFEPLGSEKYNNPYFPEVSSHYIDDQDSEVLKVERELRQLEQEELERQKESIVFRKNRTRNRLANRHSLENICDDSYANYANISYRKSLPDLQQMPVEFRQSMGDVPSAYSERSQYSYQTSNPSINSSEHNFASNNLLTICNRKSMPELQHVSKNSAFMAPVPIDRRPIKPCTKPLRPTPNVKTRVLTPSLKTLSAVPRSRHSDSWITPKTTDGKNYSQHWVIQEAELRRLTDQQKVPSNRNSWQQGKHDKPLPDSVIQTITQRVQNRNSMNERNQHNVRHDQQLNSDYTHHPIYVNHPPTMGHSMTSVPFSPPAIDEGLQDGMLSVSGKKKCSYCSNELGRGAAMIIESLCLFYHMECFKCCVCHIQLGDGRIGTDVRVRNQKLHCHNCYSSDDGVKFSCV